MSLQDIFRKNSDQIKAENLKFNGEIRYHEEEIRDLQSKRLENLRELARMGEL
jgi:hypothetical protein